ncbi:DUF262 domain-containing protein [Candidatus Parabeggiatoa sp. HSG14]|uniref:DUF262 domain-containing protein n=1 Tax=Candidatus Parabeggiatoa sp. HSG14 TaxID=3055593 RepID=UPI0025A8E283|nr:DUF262 domain-containing protein [Thiotrichales bacterium HSG14]
MVDNKNMTDKNSKIYPENELQNYPIDSLLIRSEKRTVYEITRRINQQKPNQTQFILNPYFQRDFFWSKEKQSKLIESCLMRVPLPVFYFAEQENGNIVVVDGLQRLIALKRYLSNEFALQFTYKSPLQGQTFEQLSPKLQNRLEETQLILYIIDYQVPELIKLELFERVNSGESLTRQQMRHALYNGSSTYWLKKQAQNDLFKKNTGFTKNPCKEMRDCEYINRFCAFILLGIDNYHDNMDQFLAETLKYMNEMTDSELNEQAEKFQRSMVNNNNVFGDFAFRNSHSKTRKCRLNIALFDVFSVCLSNYSETEVSQQKDKISQAFGILMNNKKFKSSINSNFAKANQKYNIEVRFSLVKQMLNEVMK